MREQVAIGALDGHDGVAAPFERSARPIAGRFESHIVVRPYRESDLSDVISIWFGNQFEICREPNETSSYSALREFFVTWVLPCMQVTVADVFSQTAGFLVTSDSHIVQLHTSARHRRMGVASRLLEFAMSGPWDRLTLIAGDDVAGFCTARGFVRDEVSVAATPHRATYVWERRHLRSVGPASTLSESRTGYGRPCESEESALNRPRTLVEPRHPAADNEGVQSERYRQLLSMRGVVRARLRAIPLEGASGHDRDRRRHLLELDNDLDRQIAALQGPSSGSPHS